MATINCRNCAREMSDTDRFCSACGVGPSSVPKDITRKVGWDTRVLLSAAIALGISLLTFLFLLVLEAFRSAGQAMGVASPDLTAAQKLSLIGLMLIAASAGTFIRQNYRAVYGMTEVAFAIAFAWRVLGRDFQPDALANVVVLFSLVYLAGRGMVNVVEGTKWRPARWEESLMSFFGPGSSGA